MPRINFSVDTVEAYSYLTIDDLDTMLLKSADIIDILSKDIIMITRGTEEEWNALEQTVEIPRRDDLLRVKREELDREYARREALQKILAFKDLGVV